MRAGRASARARRRFETAWRSLAAAPVLVAVTVAAAAAAPAAPAAAVLYVKHRALWVRDGGGAPRSLGALPEDVGESTALRLDPAGRTLLVGSDRGWHWSSLRDARGDLGPITLRKLPCAVGPATLTVDGSSVLCATTVGSSQVVQLATGRNVVRSLPIEQVAIVGAGGELSLLWADARGIWTAPLADAKAARQVAPQAPLRGLSVSPSGARAVGVFEGTAHQRKQVVTQEMLFAFALDGRGARRKVIQQGVAQTWSADGAWVLIQDGESACIMAATGGEYKCWRGYRGVALAADGRWALLLGNRGESKPTGKVARSHKPSRPKPAKHTPDVGPGQRSAAASPPAGNDIDSIIERIEAGSEEGIGDEGSDEQPGGEDGGAGGAPEDEAPSSSEGELHLYRATLDGAFTTPPVQLDVEVDGPAAFLPHSR